MNNIDNQFPLTGSTNRQNSPYDFRSAGYLEQQSIKSRESLDTDLVIHTKEGDKVTISSDSYTNLDTYTYNSMGMVQTNAGTEAYSEQYREITLASGKSFSFTVLGDLNEDELKDLESMLKGVDEIVSDVKEGDMEGALNGALGLGDFRTFSAYKVDISYEQYYEMTSSMAATATAQKESSGENIPAESISQNEKQGVPFNTDKFFDKLLSHLDKSNEKLLGAVKNPLNKLFQHHLDELSDLAEDSKSLMKMIDEAMKKADAFIEKMLSGGSEDNSGPAVEKTEE